MTKPNPSGDRRRAVWRHNALAGNAAMMVSNAQAIIDAPSTTVEAKALAGRIQLLAKDLATALKERIDP